MRYKENGQTKIPLSALGFGAMRLPMTQRNGASCVDMEKAVPVLRRGFELGINVVDSHPGYCAQESEKAVGAALDGWPGEVFISTKVWTGKMQKREDFRPGLEASLKNLKRDHVDFYLFHSLHKQSFEKVVIGLGLLEEMTSARDEGLIKHAGFSFHDKPEVMKEIIDTGAFEAVLCQYNLFDRRNADMMAYAKSKGLSVWVMGPLGGGRIQTPIILREKSGMANIEPSLALKFALSHPHADVVFSGMGTLEMVEENAAVASENIALSASEQDRILQAIDQSKKLSEIYCTACGYCLPCPQEIQIPGILEQLINHWAYGLTDYARRRYRFITRPPKINADACTQCGECLPKCPQKIDIPKRLAETSSELGEQTAS